MGIDICWFSFCTGYIKIDEWYTHLLGTYIFLLQAYRMDLRAAEVCLMFHPGTWLLGVRCFLQRRYSNDLVMHELGERHLHVINWWQDDKEITSKIPNQKISLNMYWARTQSHEWKIFVTSVSTLWIVLWGTEGIECLRSFQAAALSLETGMGFFSQTALVHTCLFDD